MSIWPEDSRWYRTCLSYNRKINRPPCQGAGDFFYVLLRIIRVVTRPGLIAFAYSKQFKKFTGIIFIGCIFVTLISIEILEHQWIDGHLFCKCSEIAQCIVADQGDI